MKKKTLAILLALSMVISMVPTAWAEGTEAAEELTGVSLTLTAGESETAEVTGLPAGGSDTEPVELEEVEIETEASTFTITAEVGETGITVEYAEAENNENPSQVQEDGWKEISDEPVDGNTVSFGESGVTLYIKVTIPAEEEEEPEVTETTSADPSESQSSDPAEPSDDQESDDPECTCDCTDECDCADGETCSCTVDEDGACTCTGEGDCECCENCPVVEAAVEPPAVPAEVDEDGDDDENTVYYYKLTVTKKTADPENECECEDCDSCDCGCSGTGTDDCTCSDDDKDCTDKSCEDCEDENCACGENCECVDGDGDCTCEDCKPEVVEVKALHVNFDKQNKQTTALVTVTEANEAEATRTVYVANTTPAEIVTGWQESDTTITAASIAGTISGWTEFEDTYLTSEHNGKWIVVVDVLGDNVVGAGYVEIPAGTLAAPAATTIEILKGGQVISEDTVDLGTPAAQQTATYTVKVYDQDENEMAGATVAWTVEDSYTGVSLTNESTATVTVTVGTNAEIGDATIKVASGSENATITLHIIQTKDAGDRVAGLKDDADQLTSVDARETDTNKYTVTLSAPVVADTGYLPTQKEGDPEGNWDYYLGVCIAAPEGGYDRVSYNGGNAEELETEPNKQGENEGFFLWIPTTTTAKAPGASITLTWSKDGNESPAAVTETWTINWSKTDANFARVTLKFEGNGAEATENQTALYGMTPITLPELEDTDEAEFKGWKIGEEGETLTTYTVGWEPANTTITFTAVWEPTEQGGDDCECGTCEGDCSCASGEPCEDPDCSCGDGGGDVTPPTTGGTTAPSTSVGGAKTDEDADTTTVEVNVSSTTSGTTANATVSSSSMNSAVNKAVSAAEKAETAPVVEIEVSTSSRATSLNLTLPVASLETLAEAEDSSLVIISKLAEVTLDNAALAALADEAAGNTVTLQVAHVAASKLTEEQKETVGDSAVIDLSMVSGNKPIHDYKGGKITISLPYELAEGQEGALLQVYYLPEEGEVEVCPTSYADGKVTFTTAHLSMYFVAYEEWVNPFVDVDEADEAYAAIRFAAINGLMKGYENVDGTVDHFGPEDTFNRAQMAQVLYNLAGQPELDPEAENPFSDVEDYEWYVDVIAWAADQGLITGYGDGTFAPKAGISVQEVVIMLSRAAGEELEVVAEPEEDAVKIGEITCDGWAENFVQWAVDEGILDAEVEQTVATEATRAQIAVMLMNYCK